MARPSTVPEVVCSSTAAKCPHYEEPVGLLLTPVELLRLAPVAPCFGLPCPFVDDAPLLWRHWWMLVKTLLTLPLVPCATTAPNDLVGNR